MRFKKLKISVAVALVIFAIIVANTIVFSSLQKQNQPNSDLSVPIDRKISSNTQTDTNQTSSQTISTTSNTQSQNQPQTSDTASASSTSSASSDVVIQHPMMRTRAS